MTLTVPYALVTAPDRAPLPHGLFSQLTFRPETSGRWEAGIQFQPSGCDGLTDTVPTCGPSELDLTLAGRPSEMVEAAPFSVVGLFRCSPVGFSPEDANGEAAEYLLRGEERSVERLLWSGALAVEDEHAGVDPLLSGPGVESVTTVDVAAELALAQLEFEIGRQYGSMALLHMTRSAATILAGRQLVVVRNGRLQTQLGTPIAAGSGYGGAVYAASETIVATGQPVGYRTGVISGGSVPGDLLARETNDLYGSAMRTYSIAFDNCMLPISATFDPSL